MTSVAQRFTGIITSYNITEERQELVDNFTITLNASSYKTVLQNRVAGRKTNGESWKSFPISATDTSMDNVYSLSDQYFDFGVKPKQGATTQSTASATQATSVSASNEMGGRDSA